MCLRKLRPLDMEGQRGGVQEVDDRTDVWRERRAGEEVIQGYASGLRAPKFNEKQSMVCNVIRNYVGTYHGNKTLESSHFSGE